MNLINRFLVDLIEGGVQKRCLFQLSSLTNLKTLMSKSRMINTSIWDDDYVLDLESNAKLAWLYLLTNPEADLRPFYKLPSKKISNFRLGCDFESSLKQFETDGKIKICDGYIFLVNWQKHQSLNDKQKIGIDNAVLELPEKVRKYFFSDINQQINPIEPYRTLSKGTDTLSKGTDTLSNPIEPFDEEKRREEKRSEVEEKGSFETPSEFSEIQETPEPETSPPVQAPPSPTDSTSEISKFVSSKIENPKACETITTELIRTLGLNLVEIRDFMGWYEEKVKDGLQPQNLDKIKWKLKDWVDYGKPKPAKSTYEPTDEELAKSLSIRQAMLDEMKANEDPFLMEIVTRPNKPKVAEKQPETQYKPFPAFSEYFQKAL